METRMEVTRSPWRKELAAVRVTQQHKQGREEWRLSASALLTFGARYFCGEGLPCAL